MDDAEKHLLDIVAQKIYDKKGFNILALDVRAIPSLYDYVIIAEGTVERHVQALSREILSTLHELHYPVFYVDGGRNGDWVVIDCGFLVIHLFISELREKYALEELWREGDIVDLKIILEHEGK